MEKIKQKLKEYLKLKKWSAQFIHIPSTELLHPIGRILKSHRQNAHIPSTEFSHTVYRRIRIKSKEQDQYIYRI